MHCTVSDKISTCAGVGTFILEFGSLTRLTGDPVFERAALRAVEAIWARRSKLGMLGNHVNVLTGAWTALDAGIGIFCNKIIPEKIVGP